MCNNSFDEGTRQRGVGVCENGLHEETQCRVGRGFRGREYGGG